MLHINTIMTLLMQNRQTTTRWEKSLNTETDGSRGGVEGESGGGAVEGAWPVDNRANVVVASKFDSNPILYKGSC